VPRTVWYFLIALVVAINMFVANKWEHVAGEPTYITVSKVLGAILAAMLYPFLIGIIHMVIANRRNTSRPSLLKYCAIGGILLSVLTIPAKQARFEANQNIPLTYRYTQPKCAFEATFPEKPVEMDMGGFIQAQSSVVNAGVYLRMECLPLVLQNPNEQLLPIIQKYAESNGLTNVGIKSGGRWPAVLDLTGDKLIQSVPIRYVTRVFYGDGSILILSIGSEVRASPHPMQDRFFEGAKLKTPN